MDVYTLEYLQKMFTAHAAGAEKQREEMIVKWKNEYSSDKIPESLKDTFNLPSALLVLVQEVSALKSQNASLQKQIENLEKTFTRMR